MTRSADGMAHEATSRPPAAAARLRDAPAVLVARARSSVALAGRLARICSGAALGDLRWWRSSPRSRRRRDCRLPTAKRFDSPALTHPLGGFGRHAALAPGALGLGLVPDRRQHRLRRRRLAAHGVLPALPAAVARRGRARRRLARRGAGGGLRRCRWGPCSARSYLLHRLDRRSSSGARRRGRRCCCCASSRHPCSWARRTRRACSCSRSVGAFYAARTGHWAWAGAAAAAACATRSAGVLLMLAAGRASTCTGRGADRPGRTARAGRGSPGRGAAASPAARRRRVAGCSRRWGLVAYAAWLGIVHGDPLAFSVGPGAVVACSSRGRSSGVWDGAVAAFDGARQLASGSRETRLLRAGGRRSVPRRGDQPDAVRLRWCSPLVAAVGVLRRLPFAYGAYVVAALALPAQLPGHAAAADVAAALPGGAVPDLHVDGRRVRASAGPPSAWPRRRRWGSASSPPSTRPGTSLREGRACTRRPVRRARHARRALRAARAAACGRRCAHHRRPTWASEAADARLRGRDRATTWPTTCAAATGQGLELLARRLRRRCCTRRSAVDGLDRAAVRRGDARGDRVHGLSRTPRPAAARARAPGHHASWWSATGTCSLPRGCGPAGLGGLRGRRASPRPRWARPSPRRSPFRAGLELAGVEAAARPCTSGDSPDTDIEGARAAGMRAILVARAGGAPAGVEAVASLAASCPPYSERRMARRTHPRAARSARAAGGR